MRTLRRLDALDAAGCGADQGDCFKITGDQLFCDLFQALFQIDIQNIDDGLQISGSGMLGHVYQQLYPEVAGVGTFQEKILLHRMAAICKAAGQPVLGEVLQVTARIPGMNCPSSMANSAMIGRRIPLSKKRFVLFKFFIVPTQISLCIDLLDKGKNKAFQNFQSYNAITGKLQKKRQALQFDNACRWKIRTICRGRTFC